jgi:hypothetical protein
MLRDNLVGLIEPMLNGAGDYPLALRTNWKQSSDDRPACLENPRPAGAESTLTENVASPFHAEPGHSLDDDDQEERQEQYKILNSFSLFCSKPIQCPPIRQVDDERTGEDDEQSTGRDSP